MIYDTLDEAAQAAREALEGNWHGESTVPSWGLYPHQWSWDSALIAIGYAWYNQERAQQELRSLFEAQWSNGMVPHMRFNLEAKDYFPDPEYWAVHKCPHSPRNVQASGCVQPPVHATAVRRIVEQAQDETSANRFLKEVFPRLEAWHGYLYRERDPDGDGLVYIRHPWESGRDNSPVWDELLARMQFERREIPEFHRRDTDDWRRDGRPTDKEYACYIYLCEIFKKCCYDEVRIQKECPFLVQDILFNALLCQAEKDMSVLCKLIGRDPAPCLKRAEHIAQSMRRKFWLEDHGVFLPWDMKSDRPLQRHEIGGFSPLFAGVPTQEQAERMRRRLDSEYFCAVDGEACYAVSSYSRQDIDYDPHIYWRGPVWLNINWLIAQGLNRYGFKKHEHWVLRSIRDLPMRFGFRERYNAETGEPQGGINFGWSASLFLDCYYGGAFHHDEVEAPVGAAEDT